MSPREQSETVYAPGHERPTGQWTLALVSALMGALGTALVGLLPLAIWFGSLESEIRQIKAGVARHEESLADAQRLGGTFQDLTAKVTDINSRGREAIESIVKVETQLQQVQDRFRAVEAVLDFDSQHERQRVETLIGNARSLVRSDPQSAGLLETLAATRRTLDAWAPWLPVMQRLFAERGRVHLDGSVVVTGAVEVRRQAADCVAVLSHRGLQLHGPNDEVVASLTGDEAGTFLIVSGGVHVKRPDGAGYTSLSADRLQVAGRHDDEQNYVVHADLSDGGLHIDGKVAAAGFLQNGRSTNSNRIGLATETVKVSVGDTNVGIKANNTYVRNAPIPPQSKLLGVWYGETDFNLPQVLSSLKVGLVPRSQRQYFVNPVSAQETDALLQADVKLYFLYELPQSN